MRSTLNNIRSCSCTMNIIIIYIYAYSFKIFLFPARGRCQLWYNTNTQRVPDLQEFVRPIYTSIPTHYTAAIISPATDCRVLRQSCSAAAYISRGARDSTLISLPWIVYICICACTSYINLPTISSLINMSKSAECFLKYKPKEEKIYILRFTVFFFFFPHSDVFFFSSFRCARLFFYLPFRLHEIYYTFIYIYILLRIIRVRGARYGNTKPPYAEPRV